MRLHGWFVAGVCGCASVMACTDFLLQDEAQRCVVGRSLEFGVNLKSRLILAPRGGRQESDIHGSVGMKWMRHYGYIGLDSFDDSGWIVDGVNEQGLSFGALWFPGSIYPEVPAGELSYTIGLSDVGRWILGSFANVKEVKEGLESVHIYPQKIEAIGAVPPVHLSIHDREGKSLVIEFIDGKMEICNNDVGVLTNAPKFSWHRTNLENYLNLSAVNVKPVNLDGTVLSPTGQGSGLLGLPGDWTPPSRFVRMALFKQFVKKPYLAKENSNLAFHLLNTVDIPYGTVRSDTGKNFEYTQWIVVKDLSNGVVYYRTYGDLNIRSVSFENNMGPELQVMAIEGEGK